MSRIELKRANVVKCVDSEERARALEEKGFVRTDGKTVPKRVVDADELEKKLAAAETRAEAAEQETVSVKEQLQEEEKKVRTLENELAGTKEQLEAAVKQNKAAGKK